MPGIRSGIGRFAGDMFATVGGATSKGRASIASTKQAMDRIMSPRGVPVGMRRNYVIKKICSCI